MCKEWLVHEDGALAYHLQKLEGQLCSVVLLLLSSVYPFYYLDLTNFYKCFTVDEHYNGNRSRNAIVRQDLPTAKEEQEREIREAEERYGVFIKEQ